MSDRSKLVEEEEADYRSLLNDCVKFNSGDSDITPRELRARFDSLNQKMTSTSNLLGHSRELWSRRSALTVKMSNLEMKLLPEDEEGDGSAAPGSTQALTAEVCNIAEKNVAESPPNLAASAYSNHSDISQVSNSGMEGAGGHTESQSENGLQLVKRTLSTGSHSEGEKHKDENSDSDWERV